MHEISAQDHVNQLKPVASNKTTHPEPMALAALATVDKVARKDFDGLVGLDAPVVNPGPIYAAQICDSENAARLLDLGMLCTDLQHDQHRQHSG